MEPSFDRYGSSPPASPVVVSVPHAGRDYPAALIDALRVPVAALRSLEDRRIDAVALAAGGAETMLIQRRARAWIDLNRSEDERDPRVDAGAPPLPAIPSAKLRSGLGLVPRRAGGVGDIWRQRFSAAAMAKRIAEDHRPYHTALAEALQAARSRFGAAVLLDLHSMPSLGRLQPRIVIGDRFGTAADARFTGRVEATVVAARLPCGLNAPYPGGHVTQAHGNPAAGIHAIQIEIDRSLYLDTRMDDVGPGLPRIAALIRAVIDDLSDEALARPIPVAAE
nr:N-formylglutamate amidohydrolase [Sphingomonas sp. Leaf343]